MHSEEPFACFMPHLRLVFIIKDIVDIFAGSSWWRASFSFYGITSDISPQPSPMSLTCPYVIVILSQPATKFVRQKKNFANFITLVMELFSNPLSPYVTRNCCDTVATICDVTGTAISHQTSDFTPQPSFFQNFSYSLEFSKKNRTFALIYKLMPTGFHNPIRH